MPTQPSLPPRVAPGRKRSPEREATLGESARDLIAFRAKHGGISQARAAELCGTPVRTWQNWEISLREPPPLIWRLFEYIDKHGFLEHATTEGDSAKMRAFRERYGLTQARAAEVCDTSKRTWEGWEISGRTTPGSLWVLIDYFDKFGLPTE